MLYTYEIRNRISNGKLFYSISAETEFGIEDSPFLIKNIARTVGLNEINNKNKHKNYFPHADVSLKARRQIFFLLFCLYLNEIKFLTI